MEARAGSGAGSGVPLSPPCGERVRRAPPHLPEELLALAYGSLVAWLVEHAVEIQFGPLRTNLCSEVTDT